MLNESAEDGRADQAQQRVFAVALVLIASSVVGFLLALVFQWPSQFVLGEEPDSEVTAADLISGTVTSMPLAPFLVTVVSTVLVRSRRWWGGLAALVLTVLGCVFVVGGLGEITTENADVPQAVLVVAGAAYVLLGSALALSGLHALAQRWRTRRGRPGGSS